MGDPQSTRLLQQRCNKLRRQQKQRVQPRCLQPRYCSFSPYYFNLSHMPPHSPHHSPLQCEEFIRGYSPHLSPNKEGLSRARTSPHYAPLQGKSPQSASHCEHCVDCARPIQKGSGNKCGRCDPNTDPNTCTEAARQGYQVAVSMSAHTRQEHKARLFNVIDESFERAQQSRESLTDAQLSTMTRSIRNYQVECWNRHLQLTSDEACDLLHKMQLIEEFAPRVHNTQMNSMAKEQLKEALEGVISKGLQEEAKQEERRLQLLARTSALKSAQAKSKDPLPSQKAIRIKQGIFVAIVASYFCFLYLTISLR